MFRMRGQNVFGGGILGILGGALLAFALWQAPAGAQEAAFDQPNQNPAFIGGAGSMPGRPISTSASANENKSNLKHWSNFSHGSTKPTFLRVPAGTVTGNGKLHYSRPQCVAPGQTTASKPSGNGMVKRYLAYNVPAGHFVKKNQCSVSTASTPAPAPSKRKSSSNHVPVLSYSKHHGAIITHYVPHSQTSNAVAFYSSYH